MMDWEQVLSKYGVPDHNWGGLIRWIENHIPPGSFLSAVLANDLVEAVGRADHINIGSINNIVAFLYNCAPAPCWGSKEKFNTWASKLETMGESLEG